MTIDKSRLDSQVLTPNTGITSNTDELLTEQTPTTDAPFETIHEVLDRKEEEVEDADRK